MSLVQLPVAAPPLLSVRSVGESGRPPAAGRRGPGRPMLAATSQERVRLREAYRGGAQMTAGRPARPARGQPRRELALLLLLGAAGAGLALLAARQGWARVETAAPRPLP